MADLYSGIYQHYEGTVAQGDSVQATREVIYVTTSGALRYKDCDGNYHYFYPEVPSGHTHIHNNLSSIQGGTASQYNHLTNAQVSALHSAMTVVDSPSIDFTLSGQQISGVVLPAGVNHDSLLNYSGNKHIDHTTVSIIAGSGLEGGGTLAATRTINMNHLGIQELSDPANDRIMFWDETSNKVVWLTVGTGLEINGTTLSGLVTQYTDEMAQDAAGATLTDTSSVNLEYIDGLGQITATVLPAGVDHAQLGNPNSTNYTHLTAANHTDLTDGGVTILHNHGAGTSGYLTKYINATGTIANSDIYNNDSKVGILNNSPTYTLDITGSGHLTEWLYLDLNRGVNFSYVGNIYSNSGGLYIETPGDTPFNLILKTGSSCSTVIELDTENTTGLHINGLKDATFFGTDHVLLWEETSTNNGRVRRKTKSQFLIDINAAAKTSVAGTINYIPKFITTSGIGDSYLIEDGTKLLSYVPIVLRSDSVNREAIAHKRFGYSSSYRSLMIGNSSGTYAGVSTIAFNVDTSTVAGGNFTGDGSELIFRNTTRFITPNIGGTDFQTVMTFGTSSVYLANNLFLNDNKYIKFGTGEDASILYDGTNLVFDSRVVGTGDFIFNNGKLGINTTPSYVLDVNGLSRFQSCISVGTTPNAQTSIASVLTGTNLGLTGLSQATAGTFTSNVVAYISSASINASCDIRSGVTMGGEINPSYVYSLRSLATDSGTLGVHRGYLAYVGHSNTVPSSAVTTTVVGASIAIAYGAGTITNAYGLYIGPYYTGGTVTNKWGVYEALGWNNYFAGNVGIGITTPTNNLEVVSGGTNSETKFLLSTYNDQAGFSSSITLHKSYTDTVGAMVTTISGEVLGTIDFCGVDSGNNRDIGVRIQAIQNGIASTRVPTDLLFYTSTTTATPERMRITTDGRVGIGITAPVYPLQVRRDGAVCSLGIQLDGYPRAVQYYSIGDATTDQTCHKFYVRNGTATDNLVMTIANNSTVGIGMTAPTAGLEIHATGLYGHLRIGTTGSYGRMYFNRGTDGYGAAYLGYENNSSSEFWVFASSNLVFAPASERKVTITTAGNVGIGTSGPDYKLHVIGDIKITGTNTRILAGADDGTDFRMLEGVNDGSLLTLGESFTYTYLGGAGATARVGISTSSPKSKLEISVGNVSTYGKKSEMGLYIAGGGYYWNVQQLGFGYDTGVNASTAIGRITTLDSGYTCGDLFFATRSVTTDTVPTERMRITSNGKVAIGTDSPSGMFEVRTNAGGISPNSIAGIICGDSNTYSEGILAIKNAGNRGNVGNATGSPLLVALYSDTTGLILDKNGNLGVMTSSPQYTLDVNGGGRISKNLLLNGTTFYNTAFSSGLVQYGDYSEYQANDIYNMLDSYCYNDGAWKYMRAGVTPTIIQMSSAGSIWFMAGATTGTVGATFTPTNIMILSSGSINLYRNVLASSGIHLNANQYLSFGGTSYSDSSGYLKYNSTSKELQIINTGTSSNHSATRITSGSSGDLILESYKNLILSGVEGITISGMSDHNLPTQVLTYSGELHTTSISNLGTALSPYIFPVTGSGTFQNSANETVLNLNTFSIGNTDASTIVFRKSDDNRINYNYQTDEGDYLGIIEFKGVDNDGESEDGVVIIAEQNGWADTKVPTDLIFYNADDTTLSETMRLNSDGKILVNQALPFDTNMLCIKGIVPYNGGPAAPASGISSGILWLEAYDGDHGLEIGAYNTGGGSWINIQSRHRNSSTAQPLNINQKGGRVGIGKMNTPSYELDVSGTMRVTEGFGCNGKTPQTEYTVSGVITGVADGTYSSVEQNLINSGIALLNGIRAALIANGICV